MDSAKKSMASIYDLMAESWDVCKKSWLHLFVFNLVSLVVLGLVILAGVVLVVASGAGAAFSAEQQNYALTGGLAIAAVIAGLLFILFCMAWGVVVNVGSMLIVSQKGQISLDETIKKSIGFIFSMLLIGIFNSFIIFGGFFVFILPAFLFALFFLFGGYEVVFNNKKGLDALRLSMSIVIQNFWGILGRVLLLGVIIFGSSIVLNLFIGLPLLVMDKNSVVFGLWSLVGVVIRIIFNILISFFTTSYLFTLYKQAKAAAKEGQSSLLWVGITSVIGWAIFILIIASYGGQMVKVIQESMQEGKISTPTQQNYSGSMMKSKSGSTDAVAIQNDVFVLVNETRKKSALPLIQQNSQLCAYAQRRLEQLITYGKWDDAKGFYEDTANPQIVRAYFPNFVNINEEGWDAVSASTTPETIVAAWLNRKKGTGIIPNAEYAQGCVRGSGEFLVFIAGSYK